MKQEETSFVKKTNQKRKKFAEHSEKLCKPTAKKHDAWRTDYLFSFAFTRLTTLLTVKPYFSIMFRLVQKRQIYQSQSLAIKASVTFPASEAPISIATRALTALGRTDSLYSSDCSSKRSHAGKLTTETRMPSFSSAFALQWLNLLRS